MFAPFHNEIPCERWLRALVNRIYPLTFGRCFTDGIMALWPGRHDLTAIDGKTSHSETSHGKTSHSETSHGTTSHGKTSHGKTSRRTHDKRKGLKAPHILSAYASNTHLTLAQLSVPEKSNEITAISVLLDELAQTAQLKGALVTIDAMECQVGIAAKIVEHEADFLLPLKGNQPRQEREVAAYFETAPAEELVSKATVEKGHGHIETRIDTASGLVDWIRSDRS
jgi:predicted transposase YbfD/YdcC